MTALALRMTGADFLKLRRKHWLVWLSLFLTLGVIAIVFIYKVSAHASSSSNSPAGGIPRFTDNLRVLTLFFGPLAAILIGIEAGTGDASAGVFRDLVVTGRSRLAIFASRVPAALGLCWAVTIAAYALIAGGSIVFASGQATPGGALIVNGLLFSLFATGVICVIAVGFASLTTSRAGAIVTLIAWQLIASPLLSSISSLGGVRRAILSQAIAHFSPVSTEGRHGSTVSMSSGTAILVAVLWMLLFVGLGAWRTRSMDA
jgi:ABC-type transport system involved in multi-copper enzyme maturation permease subunit